MTTQRDALLARLRETDHMPVLIVGGGINGAGTFRDLSLQGVDCLLVERDDFCSGASRAPSRMIHGGLKYLETAEFRLVRESAQERNRLLANAPHYVHPLEMVIPIHTWFGGMRAAIAKLFRRPARVSQRGALLVKLGLTIYDIYGALNRVMPRHRMIRRGDVLSEIPDLDPDIRVAASYYDAWITSPERLTVELLLDGMAENDGSLALNHIAFDGIEDGRARLVDRLSGEVFHIGCDVMVNAAGAWIDRVNEGAGTNQRMMGGTKGSHLLLDMPALARTLTGRMLYFEVEGGRICLVSNFMGHVLLGSTDIPIEDPDTAICDDTEVEYLFDAFRRIFPGVPVGREDIFFSYSGVRPLPASDADDPGAVSRDHSMPELPPQGARAFPILSLVGGKWTTFRAFSAEVTDAVLSRLGRTRRARTEDRAIGGGAGLDRRAAGHETLARDIAKAHALPRDRAHVLVRRYGSRAGAIAAELGPEEAFLVHLPDLSRQEISAVIRTELVAHAEDFLFGRSTLFLERPLSHAAVSELAETMAALLDWDDQRRADELDRIVTRYRQFHRIDVTPGSPPHFEGSQP
ncbi:glycerol-3-phosphate dehydrogenase/oxidase [Tranquillimonas rosea]|uniref:glycerol-3-phosphate dehydrogenase/oxidase n=1 Tax=Tranquillimonas rosea TaxID=641238 RepID=UPI003BADAB34